MWGRTDQYGQPWLQSFNTGGASQVFVERDRSGTPLGLHTGGNDFYLVLDNLGSVVAAVDTAGTVVARYSYDPYGNAVSVNESGLSQPNIIRYTGGALDQTTGLTKLGQRYYNPAFGAFTQQDDSQILANPQNGNLYAYAGDNPANSIDPTGLFPMPGICLPTNPMCRVSGNEWGSYSPLRPTIVAASGGCAAGIVTSFWIPPAALPSCGIFAAAGAAAAFVSYTVDWIWTHI